MCYCPNYKLENKFFLYHNDLATSKELKAYEQKSNIIFISGQRHDLLIEKGVNERFFTPLPCGKCLECRKQNKEQWTKRLFIENQNHKESCFITLTYDDEHIKKANVLNKKTGETTEVNTLNKKDIQLFLKRLRKKLKNKIKFFACGEYGTDTFRPHYHMIIFGNNFKNDIYFQSAKYYESKLIAETWQQGQHLIAEVNEAVIKYVSGYCLDKQTLKDDNLFTSKNIQKPFIQCSKGIGINALKNENTKNDLMLMKAYDKSFYTTIPNYLLNKLDETTKNQIKKRRKKIIKDNEKLKLLKTDLIGENAVLRKYEKDKNINANRHKPI